jgi:hypothetical protein
LKKVLLISGHDSLLYDFGTILLHRFVCLMSVAALYFALLSLFPSLFYMDLPVQSMISYKLQTERKHARSEPGHVLPHCVYRLFAFLSEVRVQLFDKFFLNNIQTILTALGNG